MLTVEQAKAKILEGAEAVAEVEDMVTLYSAGKILAEDIVSEIKVPPLDNSQMDGYAVRCADFAGGRRNFPVSQRIFAGHVGTELEPGTVARIFTGAPIPPATRSASISAPTPPRSAVWTAWSSQPASARTAARTAPPSARVWSSSASSSTRSATRCAARKPSSPRTIPA